MKFYLAHPVLLRKMVRRKELEIEKETGIELVNPFYDGPEADVIERLDKGEITPKQYAAWLNSLNKGTSFVEGDLKNVKETDGVVSVIRSKTFTIGTPCEMWEALKIGKPVFIITDFPSHIWIRYIVEKSGGFAVKTFNEFKAMIKIWNARSQNGEKP